MINKEKLLDYFKEIDSIPRESGNENKIANYLVKFAKDRKLEVIKDKYNNVLISKVKDFKKPIIILQGHTDMVCEKTSKSLHNFKKDPIKIINENNLLRAFDTSLGADDGVAVSYMLYLLDSDITNIECLFTVQEEIGLVGANYFDYTLLHGKYLINLDNESDKDLIIGCAGGINLVYSKDLEYKDNNYQAYKLSLSNLSGGHSGVDIGLKKQNANLLLANLLLHLNETDNIYLNSFNGGTKDNVICYESVVTFSYNNKDIENKINEYFKTINFIKEDQNYQWNLEKIDKQKVLSNERTIKILNLITNLKQNVITYDNELNMVKTSANIGVIKTENNILNLTLSLRSNDNIEKEKYIKINDEIAHKYEFKIEHIREYPGWDYNKDNKLISIYEKEYSKVFKNKLNLMTIHAGLECGIIYKKTGIKNMISVGPNIYDVHSIREHLDLKSYYKILEVIIKTINDINC